MHPAVMVKYTELWIRFSVSVLMRSHITPFFKHFYKIRIITVSALMRNFLNGQFLCEKHFFCFTHTNPC